MSAVEAFIEQVTRLGLRPRAETGLVLYVVEPVEGARIGTEVETGVAVDELGHWPQVPPHWIHLPAEVTLARTNSRPSSRPGWLMHSRQIADWGRDDPAIAWISHVRCVLGEART